MLHTLRKLKKRGIVKDDRAQALTEMVIVIPIILLVFFIILEYFQIARVSQLGNYAAYVAARTYAVRMYEDQGDREDNAYTAACIAYAPVSWLKSEEWFGSSGIGDAISELTDMGLPEAVGDIADIAWGFGVAWGVRLNQLGGGSVTYERSGSGDNEQVKVELHYAYPIGLPGLAEMWAWTGGEKDIKDTFAGGSGGAMSALSSPYPYLDITTKCAMGLEKWTGEPRERASVDSDAATDPGLEQQAEEMQEAVEEYEEAMEAEREAAEDYQEAINERIAAEEEYNAVLNDPDSTAAEIETAKDKLDAARLKEAIEKNDWLDAAEAAEMAKEELEDVTDTEF